MTLRTLFCCLAFFSLPFAAIAQDDKAAEPESQRSEKALEILKKADTAIKAVEGIRFQSTIEPAGLAVNFVAPASGSGHMVGFNGQTPEKFWGKVSTTRLGSDEKVEVEGGGNGDMYFLIDHGNRKGYEDMDPGVMGSTGQILQNIGMIEYVHTAPFDDELSAEVIELLEDGTVGEEPCHKVRVVYANNQGESQWLFSKNDFLPRQRVRVFKRPEGDGSITITITNLEIDPKVDDGDYLMKLPEGYEQIDDFAP